MWVNRTSQDPRNIHNALNGSSLHTYRIAALLLDVLSRELTFSRWYRLPPQAPCGKWKPAANLVIEKMRRLLTTNFPRAQTLPQTRHHLIYPYSRLLPSSSAEQTTIAYSCHFAPRSQTGTEVATKLSRRRLTRRGCLVFTGDSTNHSCITHSLISVVWQRESSS